MKIAIFGATGGIGRHLVNFALDGGHEVTACARRPEALAGGHARLAISMCDVRDPASVENIVQGQDAIFIALGETHRGATSLCADAVRNIRRATPADGSTRIVMVSNFGADREKSEDVWGSVLLALSRRVIRHVLADHQAALSALRAGPDNWVAVRPMVLTHGRRTGRYRVLEEGLLRGGRKISRADVADFMLRQLHSDVHLGKAPTIAY